jgi:Flp pilus assembly protein TadD
MRDHRVRTAAWAALLLLGATGLAAQEWAGRGRVQGTVRTEDGTPIVGARVTLLLGGEEGKGPTPTETGKKGQWSVLGLATGTWSVLVDADGYKGAVVEVRVISEGIGTAPPVAITLNPIPKELAEASQAEGPRAMVERGNALFLEKKYAEARAEYQNALAALTDPASHPPVLQGVARTYYEGGQAAEALQTLEQALAIAPDDQETLKLLVTLLMAEGKVEEAGAYQARIVGEFKLDPNTLLNLGINDFNAGKIPEALSYFERVVAENPALPDAYFYRGLAYLNQGRTTEAKADFQKLLELAPDHPKAAEAREFLAAL